MRQGLPRHRWESEREKEAAWQIEREQGWKNSQTYFGMVEKATTTKIWPSVGLLKKIPDCSQQLQKKCESFFEEEGMYDFWSFFLGFAWSVFILVSLTLTKNLKVGGFFVESLKRAKYWELLAPSGPSHSCNHSKTSPCTMCQGQSRRQSCWAANWTWIDRQFVVHLQQCQ